MESKTFSLEWGGRTLTVETGKFAQQAHGACTVTYGGTVVLATAVMEKTARDGIDYFPLMVDYEEKLYAAGKIKGSRFIKRETRPSDDAVTIARMIDRSLRPLFSDSERNDVQIIVTTLSFDNENDTDILGLIASAIALEISDIPFAGPLAGCRVGLIPSEDGTKKEWVLNPTYDARDKSVLDLIVAGTGEKILMIEAGAKEVAEDDAYAGMEFANKHTKKVIDLIAEVKKAVGKPKRQAVIAAVTEGEAGTPTKADLKARVDAFMSEHARAIIFNEPKASKAERKATFGTLAAKLEEQLLADQVGKDKRKTASSFLKAAIEHEVTRAILEDNKRVDGRALTDIRQLESAVALLPRTHGSGLFHRGETQVLSIVTLGAPGDKQIIEGIEDEEKKRYMHHYNFPPFSVGEVKPLRGASRRDIGHGALAEKALEPVLPPIEQFPYTIRVVSEVMGSNGSSSMASVCGSTLSLMDAGVPLVRPVAGIAMGLASDETTGKWKILTDLQDLEDGKGGMDFKIAGTREGITAIQLDTKTSGLPMDLVQETLARAYTARLEILDVMAKTLAAPRADLSQYAPRIITLQINPEMIRNVIGPGGKQINEIIDKTGVDIDIEQNGLVFITSTNKEGADRAVAWVKELTRVVAVGETFKGKVTRLMTFGAFVEILPKQEGLVHISELAPYRVNEVTDIVKIGMEIPVKVIEIDDQGRINLSLKQTDYANYPPEPPAGSRPAFTPRPSGGFGGPRRNGPPPRGGSRPRY